MKSKTIEGLRGVKLLEGIIVAAALSVVAFVGSVMAAIFVSSLLSFRLILAIICLGYIVYLSSRAAENRKSGRVSVVLGSSIALWFAAEFLSFGGFVVASAAMLTMIRSFYRSIGFLGFIMDGSLTAASLGFALLGYLESQSPFLGVWIFFLLQALHIFIRRPSANRKISSSAKPSVDTEENFLRAHKSAETALQHIIENS